MAVNIPPDEMCVLGPALRRQARERGGQIFVRFAGGGEWSFAETLARAERCAAGLAQLGVGQGDRVMVWLPNGPDMLRVWFGVNLLGAVFVPLNTAYRGALLAHVAENADAAVAVAHADLVPRLEPGHSGRLRRIVVFGGSAQAAGGIETLDARILDSTPVKGAPAVSMRPWDLQAIIYTSGTTGASKGVLTPYLHLAQMALAGREMITASDRRLVNLPLFHAGGLLGIYGMLLNGGSIVLGESFNTATFWQTVRDSRATVVTLLGAMVPFLMKAPPGVQDNDHSLRIVSLVPLPEGALAFAERFGVTVYTNYNSTETSNPLVSDPNPAAAGLCGRPRPGIEARLVDDHDVEVPEAEVGELILRSALPWAMTPGYNREPEATAHAWRNGWFHTGDLFRRDVRGNYFFADRKKDAIRRRGENISSFEVEVELMAHPAVREAAVVGVASEFGEDEVLAVVAPRTGARIDCANLFAFLRPRMAHFMLPRYIRVMEELPKTPTHKVQKFVLRSQGCVAGTWDRDAAGIVVKREKLGR